MIYHHGYSRGFNGKGYHIIMRILLVEDDQNIASFVLTGLREAGFVTDHVNNGEDGLDLALAGDYAAAVIDIMLPKMDGLTLIEELRRNKVTTPIIILSAKRTLDDRIKGLRTGSDDYLTKPFSFSELLARLQALIRRVGGYSEVTRFELSDLSVDVFTRDVIRDNKKIELQPREFDLLVYLLRHTGRVVSKTMIMEHVWNYHFVPETNVVEARISKLREKIDKNFEPKLIHTVRGVGYVIKTPS